MRSRIPEHAGDVEVGAARKSFTRGGQDDAGVDEPNSDGIDPSPCRRASRQNRLEDERIEQRHQQADQQMKAGLKTFAVDRRAVDGGPA